MADPTRLEAMYDLLQTVLRDQAHDAVRAGRMTRAASIRHADDIWSIWGQDWRPWTPTMIGRVL